MSGRSVGTPIAHSPGWFIYTSSGGYRVRFNDTVENLCKNSTFLEEFPDDCKGPK